MNGGRFGNFQQMHGDQLLGGILDEPLPPYNGDNGQGYLDDMINEGDTFDLNDVCIGGVDHAKFIVLTGPNMGGKSTLLHQVYLALILAQSSATCRSVVALDELVQGTATSNGQAIAASVLEHLVNKVQFRGLFSTNYHHLALEYQQTDKHGSLAVTSPLPGSVGGLQKNLKLKLMSPCISKDEKE
ncbi:unnamed protein product [Lactuca saligna]|uniref:DNA mismatch repair proteins mutS family domain-containing protein n=1 Tax=Lactuca saligna TaxID=75948 RepID=A0AA35YKY8_LACSI|nr:unnamed protein product [Lactuca saligna]